MKCSLHQFSLLFAALACAAGCAHHTQHAPSLTNAEPAPATQPATHKGFFSRTADATWEVVSAPVRLVTPQKKTPAAEPVTYQAPEAVIIVPQAEGGEGLLGVATQPATTLPK
ncbi:MAG TPA: hypothetical protein VM008_21530 [Phycisphaerae bacterium]|nr:hypothetical protein [Phycisphaerae bacterium]